MEIVAENAARRAKSMASVAEELTEIVKEIEK